MASDTETQTETPAPTDTPVTASSAAAPDTLAGDAPVGQPASGDPAQQAPEHEAVAVHRSGQERRQDWRKRFEGDARVRPLLQRSIGTLTLRQLLDLLKAADDVEGGS